TLNWLNCQSKACAIPICSGSRLFGLRVTMSRALSAIKGLARAKGYYLVLFDGDCVVTEIAAGRLHRPQGLCPSRGVPQDPGTSRPGAGDVPPRAAPVSNRCSATSPIERLSQTIDQEVGAVSGQA